MPLSIISYPTHAGGIIIIVNYTAVNNQNVVNYCRLTKYRKKRGIMIVTVYCEGSDKLHLYSLLLEAFSSVGSNTV